MKDLNWNQLNQLNIDHDLTFDSHISNICKTTGAKIKGLSKIRNSLDKKQMKLLHNSLISSQFNYCSTTWMFCIKTSSKKIEQTQKEVYERFTMSLTCLSKNY